MNAVLNTPHTRSTAEWQAADSAHYLHPFTDFKGLANKGSRVITKADNIYLWDSEGNKILDAMSGLWCVNVGYGRQELIDAATRQLKELPFYNSFFQTATPPAIELAELLAEVTPPQFQHVFYSGSGSEGNDTVVRMVRRYWDVLGQPQRKVIISRKNAYHGSTMAGASLGGMSGMHEQGGLPIPDIVHIEQPFWFELGREHVARCLRPEGRGLAGSEDPRTRCRTCGRLHRRADPGRRRRDRAARHLLARDPAHLRQVRHPARLRRGHHRLRPHRPAGSAASVFGSRPDLMTFAKGVTSGYIPLGGVMVGERIARVLIDQGGEFNHGYTYSGHPVACAVALANIRLIQREGLVESVCATTSGPTSPSTSPSWPTTRWSARCRPAA